MGDRFQVRRAVAELDKKALIILEPVRCPGHGVVPPVRVVILEHLADPLLEIRAGDDLEVGLEPQAPGQGLALRRRSHDREVGEAAA